MRRAAEDGRARGWPGALVAVDGALSAVDGWSRCRRPRTPFAPTRRVRRCASRSGAGFMTNTGTPTPSLQAFLEAFNAHDVDATRHGGQRPEGATWSVSRRSEKGSRHGSMGSRTSTTATSATGHAVAAAYPSGRYSAPSWTASPSRWAAATYSS